jgi:tetraacyldisaccharide 4'-kinase
MKVVAKALAGGFEQISQWKADAFKKGWLRTHKVSVPVISVGNLTVGGTGKTPVSAFLLNLLLENGKRPGVVLRSYKAKTQTIQKVNPSSDRAEDVGDEALLLAQKFPNLPVYSGPRKWQVAEDLSRKEKVDVIILDDGYQHLHLHRDLNILLLDASEDPKNYQCVPAGRARENFSAIDRAQIFFLSKCNLASPENLQFHRERLAGKEVFEFDYQFSSYMDLKGSVDFKIKPQKILLVSALAKPESFKKLASQSFPGAQIKSLEYADHYHYGAQDIKEIRSEMQKGNFDLILTTEKDGVKLQKLSECEGLPIWQASLSLKPKFSGESLYEKIRVLLA